MISIKCDKHDVCVTCSIPRKDLTEIPWGHPKGFKCKPCAWKEHELEKAEALSKMSKFYDEWNYDSLDQMTCPYCDYEFDGSHDYYESDEEEVECGRCDNKFTVTAIPSVTFTTARIEHKDSK